VAFARRAREGRRGRSRYRLQPSRSTTETRTVYFSSLINSHGDRVNVYEY
jgi:hypothetical protein